MADTGNASEMRHLAPSRGPIKGSPNLSGGWVVMLLSGLIAAVLFLFATQQSSNKTAVVVLSKNVSSGQAIDGSFFTRAEISANDAQINRLIKYDDRNRYDGWVSVGPMESGDLVPKSALSQAAATNQRRSMSVPVEKSHANNGNLRAGDRIDVINPDNPEQDAYVARNVEILTVEESGASGIGAVQSFIVTVAVDENQALKISQAVRDGKFDIIRTTGASTTAPASSAPSGTTTTTRPTAP